MLFFVVSTFFCIFVATICLLAMLYSIIKILVRSVMGVILLVFLLVGGLLMALSTDVGQEILYEYTFRTLQNTLNTRLAVKEIKADIIRGRIMLHGFELDDRAGVTMLTGLS